MGRFFRLEAHLVPWFALMGASFWALAPLNVSAVLYVVQRMALLALVLSGAAAPSDVWILDRAKGTMKPLTRSRKGRGT